MAHNPLRHPEVLERQLAEVDQQPGRVAILMSHHGADTLINERGHNADRPGGAQTEGGRSAPEGCETTIRDEIPPRGVKWATRVIRRGATTATRSSRMQLVTFS